MWPIPNHAFYLARAPAHRTAARPITASQIPRCHDIRQCRGRGEDRIEMSVSSNRSAQRGRGGRGGEQTPPLGPCSAVHPYSGLPPSQTLIFITLYDHTCSIWYDHTGNRSYDHTRTTSCDGSYVHVSFISVWFLVNVSETCT